VSTDTSFLFNYQNFWKYFIVRCSGQFFDQESPDS
jgi:hypothetical protein